MPSASVVDMKKQYSNLENSQDLRLLNLFPLQSSEELRTSVNMLSERVSWLENNQDALMTQVEQCNRYVCILNALTIS